MVLTLWRKTHVTGNIWLYDFKPSGPLSWQAGQFIRVELPHASPDAEGTKRQFTIASSPGEGIVRLATRQTTSTFKQALDALRPWETINLLDPPAGDFIWRSSPQPLVFVASGIGITPFYAMLKDRILTGASLAATLLFYNRDQQVPFQAELESWAKSHAEFTLIQSSQPFTAERLAKFVPQLNTSLIYISGPSQLIELFAPPYNVPSAHVKQDYFPNYAATDY